MEAIDDERLTRLQEYFWRPLVLKPYFKEVADNRSVSKKLGLAVRVVRSKKYLLSIHIMSQKFDDATQVQKFS
jgi:hypothetical protein